ncbi:MAG: NAD+ synthase, partial [Actinobacteria bacterium]
MPTLRLALAQVNPTVGDLDGNVRLIREQARAAADAGAHLAVFPELALTGYPVEDLVFRESFLAAARQALHQLASDLAADGLGDLPVLVGCLDADGPARHAGARRNRGVRNSAAVLHRGRIAASYAKHHLPTYGVFDEDRYFVPGDALTVVRIGGVDVALTICEDLWRSGGPVAAARRAGVGLVLTINGSPFEVNKHEERLALVRRRATEVGAAVAYVNLVGGQDELVFDGDSMIVAADGALLARAPRFTPHLLVHDVTVPLAPPAEPAADEATGASAPPPDRSAASAEFGVRRVWLSDELAPPPGPRADGGIADPLTGEAEVWQALVLGLRDYVQKNGFLSVLLGLSGGIDSAVAATIAVDALGAERVFGIAMPSAHSSAHSRADAAELARRTGLNYRVQPIQPMVDAFLANLSLSGVAV